MLGELVKDGWFLAVADPLRTLRALSGSTDPQVRRASACYSIAFDRLRDEPADVRFSYLQMTARQQRYGGLAESWAQHAPLRRWTVPWAVWLPTAVHRTIFADTRVSSVALGTLDGRPVIVSGGRDATIRVWDAMTGIQCGKQLGLQRDYKPSWIGTSVALASLDGRSVVAASDLDNSIRVWDLAAGIQVGDPLYGHEGVSNEGGVSAIAVGILNGRPVIVSSGDSGFRHSTVRVWDIARGRQRGEPLRGHKFGACSVTVGMLDNRPVIVSGGQLNGTGVGSGLGQTAWRTAAGTRREDFVSRSRDARWSASDRLGGGRQNNTCLGPCVRDPAWRAALRPPRQSIFTRRGDARWPASACLRGVGFHCAGVGPRLRHATWRDVAGTRRPRDRSDAG